MVIVGSLSPSWPIHSARMRYDEWPMNRRDLLKLLGAAGLAGKSRAAEPHSISLFDGKTLDGWTLIENNETSVTSGGILDPAGFIAKLLNGTDSVSRFLREGMDASLRSDLAAFNPSAENAKAVVSSLARYINRAIASAPIDARGANSRELAHLNRLALERSYPKEIDKSGPAGWIVKDGAMASTGSGRGVIYTARDFSRFRLAFTMRHVSGDPDHQACVLIFCSRPRPGDLPLDALGGIQFQVPNGGHWDYRVGRNDNGGAEFTQVVKGQFNGHEWSRVEILADASTGTASMTVAQPVGANPIEVLRFHDLSAGKTGPIAWQMHNAGLFDEFKDISIEIDPR